MKKLTILFLLYSLNTFANDRNLYEFSEQRVNRLLKESEIYYKEEYPKNPLPESYYKLSKKHKVHYLIKKLIEVGYEDNGWFGTTEYAIRDNFTNAYEEKIGKLPDEYYLIEDIDERTKFINDALEKYYTEMSNKERERKREIFNKAGNVVGIVNPPVGLMFQGMGAVQ